jgi:hypothetical protein
VQLQLRDEIALVREGRVVHVLCTDAYGAAPLPRIESVRPLAVCGAAPAELRVVGRNITGEGAQLLCRSAGARAACLPRTRSASCCHPLGRAHTRR